MPAKKLQKHLTQLGKEISPPLQAEKAIVERKLKELEILSSVTLGLYDESDKLCKKAPGEVITELGLEHTNDVIREAKELGGHDPYLKKLREFVSAGDRPELRDVVMVLRQVRQGLERATGDLKGRLTQIDALIAEADGLETVIDWIEGGTDPDQLTLGVLTNSQVHISRKWMTYNDEQEVWVFDPDSLSESAIRERLTLPPL